MKKDDGDMSNDMKDDAKEHSLWKRVTDTVNPLTNNRAYNFFKSEDRQVSPKSEPKQSFKNIFEMPFTTSPKNITTPVTPSKKLSHGDMNGLNRKHAKKFKSGKLDVSATLDLHGLTQAEAHKRVFSFMNVASDRGYRKIIIITGKGKGILQSSVPEWLNSPALRTKVLSFDYAQGHHGGSGALYVLLKRSDK